MMPMYELEKAYETAEMMMALFTHLFHESVTK